MNGAAAGAASKAASSAPKTSAPKTSAPSSSAPQSNAPKTSAPSSSAPQSQNLGSSGSYQADTNGYRPSSENTSASSSLPSSTAEGQGVESLEQGNSQELQNPNNGMAGENLGQVAQPTADGVQPDVDDLTPEQLEDPDIKNSQKDVDELQAEKDAAQAEAEAEERAAEEEPQKGDKVDDGKQIGDEGQVEDTATSKTAKAAGRIVAAYYTGGKSLQYDQQVLNNGVVDKTIGVVSDVSDQVVPGLKQTSEALDELEVPDIVNNALDTAGNAMNKDIGGTIESAKKTKDSIDKSKEKVKKKIIAMIIQGATTGLICIFMFLCIVGPIIGGVMYLTDKVVEIYNAIKDGISEAFEDVHYGTLEYIDYQKILNDIPDYNKLPKKRKEIINVALSAVGGKYFYGGKPTGPGVEGLPPGGIDCSGFVYWVYWTVTGEKPGFSGTYSMVYNPPDEFIPINVTELKPGDIVVYNKGDKGHTGIYAGDGEFIHAAGKDYGIVKGSSSSLSNQSNGLRYYRYEGID